MAIILDHAPVNWSTGPFQTVVALLPDQYSVITIRVARNTTATPTFWPNVSTRLAIEIYYSLDAGSSWHFACGCGAKGGIHVHREGHEAIETTLSCRIPERSGPKRRLRLEGSIESGPLVSQLTIEAD